MKKIIINVLLIVFTAVLVFSGYRLYSIFSEYRRGREQYRKTSEQFMKEREDTGEGSGAGGEEEIEKAPSCICTIWSIKSIISRAVSLRTATIPPARSILRPFCMGTV